MLKKEEIALLTKFNCQKARRNEVLQNFQLFVTSLNAQDTWSLLGKRGEDTLARSSVPDDFKHFIPLCSMADGNCLFNSMSTTLHGHEN